VLVEADVVEFNLEESSCSKARRKPVDTPIVWGPGLIAAAPGDLCTRVCCCCCCWWWYSAGAAFRIGCCCWRCLWVVATSAFSSSSSPSSLARFLEPGSNVLQARWSFSLSLIKTAATFSDCCWEETRLLGPATGKPKKKPKSTDLGSWEPSKCSRKDSHLLKQRQQHLAQNPMIYWEVG